MQFELDISPQLETTLQSTLPMLYPMVSLHQLISVKMYKLKLVAAFTAALLMTIVSLDRIQSSERELVLNAAVSFLLIQWFHQADSFLQVKFGVEMKLNSFAIFLNPNRCKIILPATQMEHQKEPQYSAYGHMR